MNIADKVAELEKIASYCSDEYFDYIAELCNMYTYHRNMMSKLLLAALEDSISEEYDEVKAHARLVEETETIERKHYTVEWID